MVTNHLLLLGTLGWFTAMLLLITYYSLCVDHKPHDEFDEEFMPMTDGEKVYLPSSMYPHNEFMQLTTLPFITEQAEALQFAG